MCWIQLHAHCSTAFTQQSLIVNVENGSCLTCTCTCSQGTVTNILLFSLQSLWLSVPCSGQRMAHTAPCPHHHRPLHTTGHVSGHCMRSRYDHDPDNVLRVLYYIAHWLVYHTEWLPLYSWTEDTTTDQDIISSLIRTPLLIRTSYHHWSGHHYIISGPCHWGHPCLITPNESQQYP